MNEELNGSGTCRSFDNLRTTCLFPIDKLGTMAATAVLNPCKQPAELDLSTETPAGRVLSSFVAGNQVEWRQIGPEYWPLGLSVRFERTTEDTFLVKACLDTIRTGHVACFLDQNVTRPVQCSSYSGAGTHSVASVGVICVLLAAVLLTLVISVAILIKRKAARKGCRKSSHHKQLVASSLPTLPIAKPYGTRPAPPDSRGLLLTVIEEDDEVDTSRALLLIEDGLSSHDDSKRSKEVQTSATSLNTSGLGSAGSSSGDHDKSSSPYGVVLESPL
uniref:Uncharacterized protein n=1 Tax=Plectus sambesii TaxID=2011161 RepID=A0A914USB0_9BILA